MRAGKFYLLSLLMGLLFCNLCLFNTW